MENNEIKTILTKEELARLREILGREPNAVEIGMFDDHVERALLL